MPLTREELIRAIKEYALDNYNKDGWDFVVECWEDKDIDEAIGKVQTLKEALRRIKRTTKLLDERRREVENTKW